jgi:putative transposase
MVSQKLSIRNYLCRYVYVSTVGHDEATIREYIKNQEKEDQRIDQLSMFQE